MRWIRRVGDNNFLETFAKGSKTFKEPPLSKKKKRKKKKNMFSPVVEMLKVEKPEKH